jgi:16S rRNA (guanine527-N7)-methyltransferase
MSACRRPSTVRAVSSSVRTRLAELSERFALPAGAAQRLERLLDLVAAEPSAITSVRDPARGVDVHVADSLVALDLAEIRAAGRIADLGAGGGFPGLALAIALPDAGVALVESVARKCAFLEAAVRALGLDNAKVVNARAEAWPAGLEAHAAVTARALAPLPVLLEYAAPLLRPAGLLVAWKTRVAPAEDADAAAAAAVLGMSAPVARPVDPFEDAGARYLYLSSKVGSTPKGYPRRPGMARKRPLGASTGR